MSLRIAGGAVHDPPTAWTARCATSASTAATSSPTARATRRRIDARGMVVMPGGVDIHAHIAGPKVNAARKLAGGAPRRPARPDRDLRSGTRRDRPVTFTTGYRYALLGYTTVDRGRRAAARRPPRAGRAARHADDRQGVPDPDGQQPDAVRPHPRGERRARSATRSPGGSRRPAATASSSSTRAGSSCGSSGNGNVTSLDDEGRRLRRHAAPGRSTRSAPRSTSSASRTRCTSTATTSAWPATRPRRSRRMRTLEGRRAHIAHIQFHSLRRRPGRRHDRARRELAEYLNAHPSSAPTSAR